MRYLEEEGPIYFDEMLEKAYDMLDSLHSETDFVDYFDFEHNDWGQLNVMYLHDMLAEIPITVKFKKDKMVFSVTVYNRKVADGFAFATEQVIVKIKRHMRCKVIKGIEQRKAA